MQNRKGKIVLTVVFLCLVAVWIGWICYENRALEVTAYTITDEQIPASFDGYRIAHLSDLHNEEFGTDNEQLFALLESTDPDMIVITGDMLDSRRTDRKVALSFAEKALLIAPVYYVSGNHESRLSDFLSFQQALEELGVTVMDGKSVVLEKDGAGIRLLGIQDPRFHAPAIFEEEAYVVDGSLAALGGPWEEYTVLLSHRPEYFDLYVQYGVRLVLSGHAHGGQFRLPFIGGLLAPRQGSICLDAGVFTEEKTTMIISRGIGNSVIPLRINNRPEIVLVELRAEGSDLP